MASENVLREMFRGDTYEFLTKVRNANGGVYDLTGAKLWMTAKNAYAELDSEAVFKLNSDAGEGITVVSAANGEIKVVVPPAKTATLADGIVDLVYDIVLRDGANVVSTVESGKLRVKPRATRILT